MNASQIRLKARDSLKGNYWPAVGVAFVAAIFGSLLSAAGSVSITIDEDVLRFLYKDVPAIVVFLLVGFASATGIMNFLHLILGGVIQLGYAQYLLKQHDREISTTKELFSRFDYFGQGFLQRFLRILFTFLWALLFVIPGVIKIYAYSMTPFIMAENPEMKARDAMRLSEMRMKGHKWELFCLEFSFIGWTLLCVLTLGIGSFFLHPYTNAAYAAFYRDKISPKTAVTVNAEAIPQLDVNM